MLSQITDQSIYIGRSPLYAPKPVYLLAGLTSVERKKVLSLGESRFVPAGKQVFLQGQPHVGILIILNGQIRSYYVSPAGREITLAYWGAGHFVGGHEIFGGGVHMVGGSGQGLPVVVPGERSAEESNSHYPKILFEHRRGSRL
jgi:CRP-like cAMP-binding protein